MSITKPFTFVSGTYAKSAEVNADFDTAYSQINTNISNITKNANEITNLDNTKANINGNASEVFNVANPTASSHAMNKQTFFNLTSNMKYFIAGYVISIDSGSPNNTIRVSDGSCYDSAYQVMLTKNVATTKQNTSQTASATYYVYVIGNSTGSSVDILISTSSSNPGLPTGYTVYRQIGYYTTNSSSKISNVYSYGHSATELNFSNAKAAIIQTYINGSSGYRIWSDGYCEQWGHITGTASYTTVSLLKTYANTNYNALFTMSSTTASASDPRNGITVKTTSTIGINCASYSASESKGDWRTFGYLAGGQY